MIDEQPKITELRIRDKANKLKSLLHKDPRFTTSTVDSTIDSFDVLLTKQFDLADFTGQVQYREYYNNNVNPELNHGTKTDLYIFGNNKSVPIHFTEGDSIIAKDSFENKDKLKPLEESIDSILNELVPS